MKGYVRVFLVDLAPVVSVVLVCELFPESMVFQENK